MHVRLGLGFLLGVLASSALAQDGGQLAWRGKGGSAQEALAEAKIQRMAMMLFFTSEGSEDCKILSAGALSEPEVINAARSVACIFVECQGGKKNAELAKHYHVTAYPTLVFCDPSGNAIASVKEARLKDLDKVLRALGDKFPPGALENPLPSLKAGSFAEARAIAKKTGKPIALYFFDDSPPSKSVTLALADESVRKLLPRFVFAAIEYKKGSEAAARFDVSRSPTLLVLDAALEKPEEKPLARIVGSRSSHELVRDLEAALPARGREEAPFVKPPAGPNEDPTAGLSNDEIEGKFIRARIIVAGELARKGMKDKAVEILEDVIQNYPKHVETAAAKKILEDLKK